jgi:pyrroloquinoline quinone (PQQ) biosynthesis protein C
MTFKEYWDTKGTRFYAEHHEDRARHAWEFLADILHRSLTNRKKRVQQIQSNTVGSIWIALEDIVEDIERDLKDLEQ